MKRIITLIAALVLSSLAVHAADPSAKKPNFVVILSDDQTYRAIGYNNPVVKTPNMDRLANDGFRFDRFFVASPICVASRASIYTGVYPQQHGAVSLFGRGFQDSVVKGKRFVTLPATMSAAGYHTALWGKSHLGEPTTWGFDEGEEFHDPNDEQTFAAAEKFLAREAKSGRPFLLWLTPRNPHLPLSAPQRFKDIYKDADITLDPNWRESPLLESEFNQGPAGAISFRDSVPIYPRAPKGLIAGPPRDEAVMKEVIRQYYGDVSCLDEQIGTLVAQLKANGLYENTIIIYLSDNGYHLGNHGLGNKVTMHEESVRVPMFIHSPLLANKRAKSDALTSSLDVFPTILALAGVTAPPQLMGKSLLPILESPTESLREHVVTECVGPPDQRRGVGHRMVRTDHLKYVVTSSDEEAFFDLSRDPYELKNLIADASRTDEIERHRRLLHEWSASVGEKRLPLAEVKETKPSEGRRVAPKREKKDAAKTEASSPKSDDDK
ncbi:MAG: sulfatase-like hydrolase/transferase [Chthoniobacteraceae bacterium]